MAIEYKEPDFTQNIFNWIISNSKKCRINLALSGMSDYNPHDFDIETSFSKFMDDAGSVDSKLRETISDLYGVKKDEIVFTTGGSEAIFLAALYFRNTSGRALIPVPEYEPMFRAPHSIGTKTILVKEEEFQKEFNKKTDHVLISNPNNPTGNATLSDGIKMVMEESPEKLFIDEAFRDFSFNKEAYTMFSDYPDIITSVTATKFYGAGILRLGWIMARKDVARRIQELKMITSGSLPMYSLWIGNQILKNRDLFIEKAKGRIERNREQIRSFAKKYGIKSTDPGNASFCFIYTDKDGYELSSEIMEKEKILLTPGVYFGLKNGFRLCITGREEELKAALEDISKYL